MASLSMVCIESTMSKSGFTSSTCTKIFSKVFSLSTITLSLTCSSIRSARILSWCVLSSPLTYRMRFSGIRKMVCNTRVLFPMPGSPPRSTIDPLTSPPPSTRFSSPSCKSMRGSSFASTFEIGIGVLRADEVLPNPPTNCRFPPPATAGATRISLKLFHSPQLGQRPIHFKDSCPQLSQTYAVLSFAIAYKFTKSFFSQQNYC